MTVTEILIEEAECEGFGLISCRAWVAVDGYGCQNGWHVSGVEAVQIFRDGDWQDATPTAEEAAAIIKIVERDHGDDCIAALERCGYDMRDAA